MAKRRSIQTSQFLQTLSTMGQNPFKKTNKLYNNINRFFNTHHFFLQKKRALYIFLSVTTGFCIATAFNYILQLHIVSKLKQYCMLTISNPTNTTPY